MVRSLDGDNSPIADPGGQLSSFNQTRNNAGAESDLHVESQLQSNVSSDKKGKKLYLCEKNGLN